MILKIILVGNMNVGKTCLISRYVNGMVPTNQGPTLGTEFATKDVIMRDGRAVKAQIWDTAGQEKYRAITSAHYKRSVGALVVYDVTSRESFEELETWIESLIGNADANVKVMLVGNKVDKVRQNAANRQVDIAEGQQLAEQYGFMFVETSAFADENVTTAFEELLNTVVEHKLQVGDNLE